MRIGAKKRPFYRVVVVEERSKRTGGYVELLGTYNPLTEPKEIKLKQDRIDYWTKMGAQPSLGYLRIIGKAPQRAPRKPKKEVKEQPQENIPGGTAKSETAKASNAVESAAEERTSNDSVSQQTPTQDGSSGALQSDEQSTEPVTTESEKKDERSA